MSNEFELIFEYNITVEDEQTSPDQYVYKRTRGLADRLFITNRCIRIKGERSNVKALENILGRSKSDLYDELSRCIIYAYLVYGKAFIFGRFLIQYRGKEIIYKAEDIVNYYQKNLLKEYLLPKESAKIILCRDCNPRYFVAIQQFIIALNGPDYLIDDYWKAFNAIYALNSKGKERQQLEAISQLILNEKQIRDESSCALAYLKKNCETIMNSVDWWEYLDNSFRNIQRKEIDPENPEQAEIDYQNALLKTLKNKNSCIQRKLVGVVVEERERAKRSSKYKTRFHILKYDFDQDPQGLNIRINDDFNYREALSFFATRYIYTLRCFYFHAEKACPVVLSRNNDVTRKMTQMSTLLGFLVSDLFRTSQVVKKGERKE